MDHGNQQIKGRVRGVAYDDSQLSAEEAAQAAPSKQPRPKVQAAGAAGGLATLIVTGLALAGVVVPETAATALATAVLAFAAAYVRTE